MHRFGLLNHYFSLVLQLQVCEVLSTKSCTSLKS
uniref:Uncharacterized protein n=1 Tax=Manihot esculenta TaxID=3983 RepID=A0A2C9VR13_MANES